MQKDQPILVFDSGVGGLSVYDAVRAVLPNEFFRYACDNAAFPYGPKPENELLARVETVISALITQCDPKMLIIACNTASTVALPSLRARFDLPIIGVVPAIKPAARCSHNKIIGLLATPGTIARRYTDELIREFAADCDVIRVGSRELVIMAEEKLRGSKIDQALLTEILSPFWQENTRQADTIVLGCTHFPLLLDELKQAAPHIRHWVDSGAAIARRSVQLLPYAAQKKRDSSVIFTASDSQLSTLLPALQQRGLVTTEIIDS